GGASDRSVVESLRRAGLTAHVRAVARLAGLRDAVATARAPREVELAGGRARQAGGTVLETEERAGLAADVEAVALLGQRDHAVTTHARAAVVTGVADRRRTARSGLGAVVGRTGG